MKRECCEVDDLISGFDNFNVMENAEYELLVEAFESKITQKNINEIIKRSYERYTRYIENIKFDEIEDLQELIVEYLEKVDNGSFTLSERFACMKEIDMYLLKLINDVKKNKKQKREQNEDIEMEM